MKKLIIAAGIIALLVVGVISAALGVRYYLPNTSYSQFLEHSVSSGSSDFSLRVEIGGVRYDVMSTGQVKSSTGIVFENKEQVKAFVEDLVSLGLFRVSNSTISWKMDLFQVFRDESPAKSFRGVGGSSLVFSLVLEEEEMFFLTIPEHLVVSDDPSIVELTVIKNVYGIIDEFLRDTKLRIGERV